MTERKPRKTRKDAGTRRREADDKPISLRLDPSIPREAEAIKVLEHYRKQRDQYGNLLTLRIIVTEALLALRDAQMPDLAQRPDIDVDALVQSFNDQIRRLDATINRLNETGMSAKGTPQKAKSKSAVNLSYLRNLQQAMNGSEDTE